MVIDYRRVNARTRKDAYPVPLIEECLNVCKDADWMIAAFVTADGFFEWLQMPFGLATFQRYVDAKNLRHILR